MVQGQEENSNRCSAGFAPVVLEFAGPKGGGKGRGDSGKCHLHAFRLAPTGAAQFDDVVHGRRAINDANMREMRIENMVDPDMARPFTANVRSIALAGTRIRHDAVGIENLANGRAIGTADADNFASSIFSDN